MQNGTCSELSDIRFFFRWIVISFWLGKCLTLILPSFLVAVVSPQTTHLCLMPFKNHLRRSMHFQPLLAE